MLANRDKSCVVLVDVQNSFLSSIAGKDNVFGKCAIYARNRQVARHTGYRDRTISIQDGWHS